MFKTSYFHTMMTLCSKPFINQALLQFIDVMNLVDLLLHFLPICVINDAGDKWRNSLCGYFCESMKF